MSTVKIHNVRLGLANNSSSTHSLVFIPGKEIADEDLGTGELPEFGWSNWTAASDNAKRGYLALTLQHALSGAVAPEIVETVVEAWTGKKCVEGKWGADQGYIDHQSMIELPGAWNKPGVDKGFFEDFKKFLLQPGLVILGGNDNDDTPHPLLSAEKEINHAIPIETGRGSVCRFDKTENYWTIFNRYNGTKIRLSFAETGEHVTPLKSEAPELVDLKITDYCPFAKMCPWCYQDSDTKGQHAEITDIAHIISALSEMKVFEVALGGGETTLHPDFLKILHMCRDSGIVPNFTTKNLGWLKDPAYATEVVETCGSFAFSITDVSEIEKLKKAIDYLLSLKDKDSFYWHNKVSIQYVMGSTDSFFIPHIVAAAAKANFRLTLLGYKTDGRGVKFTPKPYKNWIKLVKDGTKLAKNEKSYVQIFIDTALAKESEDQLKKNGVPEWQYHKDEGKFSMYIDSVARTFAPASYGTNIVVAYKAEYGMKDKILKAYETF